MPIVCSRKGVFIGVFSNKSKMYDILSKEFPDFESCCVKLSPNKLVLVKYSKLAALLRERTMLMMYAPEDIKNYVNNIENVPATYRFWETEQNVVYSLDKPLKPSEDSPEDFVLSIN